MYGSIVCMLLKHTYSFNLSDTTGKLLDILIGSIPESKKGVTGSHLVALIFRFNPPLCGHCPDSAGNSLSVLHLLATPPSCSVLAVQPRFIGLNRADFIFFAPFLRPGFPSIAYPYWDHSCRTFLRNLMNEKVQIVSGKLANKGDGVQQYHIATAYGLQLLNNISPPWWSHKPTLHPTFDRTVMQCSEYCAQDNHWTIYSCSRILLHTVVPKSFHVDSWSLQKFTLWDTKRHHSQLMDRIDDLEKVEMICTATQWSYPNQ